MTKPTRTDYIRVQGNKEYLPVPARVQWFRGDHPTWTLDTSVVALEWEAGYVVMRAEVRDDTDRIIAAGTKTETRKGFADFVEKAETGAVGRALARAGYGTEDALDLEGERFADAPIEQPGQDERRGGATPQRSRPVSVSHPAQRTEEEWALLDELYAIPGMTEARAVLLAKDAGVKGGDHPTADQLREMIAATMIDPPDSPEPARAHAAAPAEGGAVARTASPSSDASGSADPSPVSEQAPAVPPGGEPAPQPTLELDTPKGKR